MKKLLLACLLISFSGLANTPLTIRYSADGHPYPAELLALILSKSAIAQADLKNRRIIELMNPLLPHSAPIYQPQFWLDKSSLTK